MKNLQSKGIKVITIDSDVNREFYPDARSAFVGTNNYEAGKELGKAAQALKPDGAKYVTFVGQLTAQNAIERIDGFAEGAGSSFSLVDKMEDSADRERAKENVRNAMTNHPELDMLVGIWSYNAPAIADVVQEKSAQDPRIREKVAICTFDAEPIALAQMQKGNIDVMMVQDPYAMGYEGVRLMKALVEDDQGTIAEMLPNLGQENGDIFETDLRIVVPDSEAKLSKDLFGPSTQFFKLTDFQAWMAERGLEGS
jgi:ribose transport system substrate-binding protein